MPPNRLSGPTWVHFRVIFRSNCNLFLDLALFGEQAFRLDETIVFEVLGGLISVFFCNISQYPFQCHTFRNILHFLAPKARFVVPNGSLWGLLGHHFGATLLTRFLGGVQCVPWVPKSTIWGSFWKSFESF